MPYMRCPTSCAIWLKTGRIHDLCDLPGMEFLSLRCDHTTCDREGWEITAVAAAEYWADVPLDMRAKMHYFNVPCDTAPDSPFNPLNIVMNMYQPGDFVVIKLDIDNEKIEQVFATFLNIKFIYHKMYYKYDVSNPDGMQAGFALYASITCYITHISG